jgi:hypothetical protein
VTVETGLCDNDANLAAVHAARLPRADRAPAQEDAEREGNDTEREQASGIQAGVG